MLTKDKNKRTNKLIPFIPEGDFYFTKGIEAFQKQKFNIALKWLKKAIEASPEEPVYQCQMSLIYTEIGAYHAANQLLTEVLSVQGDNYIDCYYLIANNYAHLGLLQDAKKYATLYIEKAPDGELREEAENLLLLLDIDDDDDEDWMLEQEDELLIYQETIFYHIERQEWDMVLPLVKEMMLEFPDFIAARHEYSLALFFSGEREEAIQAELEFIKDNPESLFSHSNLAIFYYEQNDFQKSNQHIKVLENVYPIHEQQKLRLANTLARTGNFEQAYCRFQSLSKIKLKGHSSYFKWYSLSAYQVGQIEKASMIWQEGCKTHSILMDQVYPWLHE